MSRAAVATGIALAASLLLASCSMPGASTIGAPSGTPATPSSAVVDPSVPTDSPTAAATLTPTPEASTPAAAPTPTASTVSDASASVTPFITSATWKDGAISVSAIVPKIVERGGTCTATAVKGGTTRSAKADAVAASSYTGCEPISIEGVTSGTWTVTVRYVSADSAGTSAARTVKAG